MVSERDRQVLDFEGSWWLFPGPKDRAIREYLDVRDPLLPSGSSPHG